MGRRLKCFETVHAAPTGRHELLLDADPGFHPGLFSVLPTGDGSCFSKSLKRDQEHPTNLSVCFAALHLRLRGIYRFLNDRSPPVILDLKEPAQTKHKSRYRTEQCLIDWHTYD